MGQLITLAVAKGYGRYGEIKAFLICPIWVETDICAFCPVISPVKPRCGSTENSLYLGSLFGTQKSPKHGNALCIHTAHHILHASRNNTGLHLLSVVTVHHKLAHNINTAGHYHIGAVCNLADVALVCVCNAAYEVKNSARGLAVSRLEI